MNMPNRRACASSQAVAGPALSGAGPYSIVCKISATRIVASMSQTSEHTQYIALRESYRPGRIAKCHRRSSGQLQSVAHPVVATTVHHLKSTETESWLLG